MSTARTLVPEDLYRRCDPAAIDFETTTELEDGVEVVGQPRAVEALRFGVRIDHPGYHIFAFGPSGAHKKRLTRHFVEKRAAERGAPTGLCYVNNFDKPKRPLVLSLPAGEATALAADMARLVDEVASALPAAFESDEYHARRKALEEDLQHQQEERIEALRQEALSRGLSTLNTPVGLVFAPVVDEEVVTPDSFKQLPEQEQERLKKDIAAMQERLQAILRQMPRLAREMRDQVRELDREVARFALGQLVDELRSRYADHPAVLTYLDALMDDLLDNARDLLNAEEGGPMGARAAQPSSESALIRRYKVNVLVDHAPEDHAPVVSEDNPSYQNLVGRIEHIAQMGALLTDFNLIEPGALHRANGGYLILEARKLLTQPYGWEGLKQALRSSQIRIESVGQMLGLVGTVSLEPEPAPLDVKVVLLGDPMLYYLLHALDPEFPQLFKVAADFDDQIGRDPESETLYARLIGQMARAAETRPLDRKGVARVIEHAARLAGDAERLSARVQDIGDLLREADHWAAEAGRELIGAEEVQQAIDAKTFREDRLRERIQQSIQRDTLHIDTDGTQIGQVNGLSVMMLGNLAFGRPSRITARLQLGDGRVLDIEREVDLGGPLHSKGVMILSSYLGARFGTRQPLSLRASLVFEQSYGGVDGDSASSAELYALLSAIGEIPLEQSLAVTGSVSQLGEVQPIGGVNEKIEGFYDVCAARGLTGEQGVLIPVANVKHLMLRQDVVDAVAEGQFHIHAVEHVDQGIELLTGLPAGEPDAEGNYPEGTVGRAVQARLAELAERRRAFAARKGEEKVKDEAADREAEPREPSDG